MKMKINENERKRNNEIDGKAEENNEGENEMKYQASAKKMK